MTSPPVQGTVSFRFRKQSDLSLIFQIDPHVDLYPMKVKSDHMTLARVQWLSAPDPIVFRLCPDRLRTLTGWSGDHLQGRADRTAFFAFRYLPNMNALLSRAIISELELRHLTSMLIPGRTSSSRSVVTPRSGRRLFPAPPPLLSISSNTTSRLLHTLYKGRASQSQISRAAVMSN